MKLNKSMLIEILSDYNIWGNFRKTLKKRIDYESKLSENLKSQTINVIQGIRRAGKSSISIKHIQDNNLGKNSLIINLEDPRLPSEINSNILMDMFDAFREYINPEPELVIIDEAQNASGWEKFARYLVESKNIKCIVTGSSAKLLSEEYATAITGRHIDITVFPLSFSEFLYFKNIKLSSKIDIINNKFKIINMLNEYIEYGGFPEIVINNNKKIKRDLVKNYFDDIIIKDVAKRYKIRNILQLEQIVRELLANTGNTASLRAISRSYNINLRTVEKYFKYLTESYLFIAINKFSFSTRKQNTTLKKVYIIDTGMYTSNNFSFSFQNGNMLENIVAIELSRRHSSNNIFYWKDYQQHEVDFAIILGNKVNELIQVTYSSSFKEVKKREIDNLIKAGTELKCNKLKIITWDYEEIKLCDNHEINFIPVWKYFIT